MIRGLLNQLMAIEKIVVVDDEMMIRKALETQLRNKRYSVASTGDLKGARKILARDSFDLVFLDPPFDQGYLKQAIDIIARRRLSRGYIYVESESDAVFTALPDNCDIYRHKSAGRVTYGLITIS